MVDPDGSGITKRKKSKGGNPEYFLLTPNKNKFISE